MFERDKYKNKDKHKCKYEDKHKCWETDSKCTSAQLQAVVA